MTRRKTPHPRARNTLGRPYRTKRNAITGGDNLESKSGLDDRPSGGCNRPSGTAGGNRPVDSGIDVRDSGGAVCNRSYPPIDPRKDIKPFEIDFGTFGELDSEVA